LGYPNIAEEMQIMEDQRVKHPLSRCSLLSKWMKFLQAIDAVKQVYLSPAIKRYIVELSTRTRNSSDVYLGASPRGSLALARAGQARAALLGRDHVLPDDIKALAVAVLAHRIIVSPAARLRDVSSDRIMQEIIQTVPAPGGSFEAGKK
jgi:MoxR-like ATPase